ncbi:MAG: MerR family transcriptional regulator [Candidatus Thiothrix moscowensis]|nr:MerR family transcriptional regulator [Candidatus Thiothrix moscowensis]
MKPATNTMIDETALFPIGTVSEQTGVNTVTLRAWERRYGLLRPRRTPKGHRLYSQQDVERVKQVLILLEQGIPVSRVRDVLDTNKPHPQLLQVARDVQTDDPWRHYRALFQRWIRKLDSRSLEHAFNEAASLYPLELLAKKLLHPLYRQLQQQCDSLPSTRADHAFLHEFLCAKLGSRYLQHNSRANGKRILIAANTNADTYQQIEGLLLANILGNHGYQTSLLGLHTTLDHLPLVLERAGFDALLITDCRSIGEDLQALVEMTRITALLCGYQDEFTAEPPDGLPIHWLPMELTEIPAAVDRLLADT